MHLFFLFLSLTIQAQYKQRPPVAPTPAELRLGSVYRTQESRNSPTSDVYDPRGPLCTMGSHGTALVIIDMQEKFILRNGQFLDRQNARAAQRAIDAQIRAIRDAKAKNIPIITVEYETYGPTDSRIQEAIGNYSLKHTVKKTTDGVFDAQNFYKNDFGALLKKYDIGNLIITGANGGACVGQSILRGLRSGCSVTAVSNAIADFNYKPFIYPYQFDGAEIQVFQKVINGQCPTCKFAQVEEISDLSNNEPSSSEDSVPTAQ